MIAYLQGSGFLGTKAGLGSDLSLVVMLAAAAAAQRSPDEATSDNVVALATRRRARWRAFSRVPPAGDEKDDARADEGR